MLTKNHDAGPAARALDAAHTDTPSASIEAAYALESAMAATDGNTIAAAILAGAVVISEALREGRRED